MGKLIHWGRSCHMIQSSRAATQRTLNWDRYVKCSFQDQDRPLNLKLILFCYEKSNSYGALQSYISQISEAANCWLLLSLPTIVPELSVSKLNQCEIFIHEPSAVGQPGIQSCGQLNLSGTDWQTINSIINQRASPATTEPLCLLSSSLPKAGVIKCKWIHYSKYDLASQTFWERLQKSHHNIWCSFVRLFVRITSVFSSQLLSMALL